MYTKFKHQFRSFLMTENGATAIEYAIIAGLLSIVIVATVKGLGTTMNAKYESVNQGLKNT